MSCAFPIYVCVNNKKTGERMKIPTPCGRCLCCRMQKQTQLKFLAERELLTQYSHNQSSAFVTLTYDQSKVPMRVKFLHASTVIHGNDELKLLEKRNDDPEFQIKEWHYTLEKSELQKFLKRLRISMERAGDKRKFKYIACGEYGEKGRCHFHLAILGLDAPSVKKYTLKAWKYGFPQIGPLTVGGIRYITKYITKANTSKEVQAVYEKADSEKEFVVHSVGIGKDWIRANLQRLLDDPFIYTKNGRTPLPKYLLNFLSNYDSTIKERVLYEVFNKNKHKMRPGQIGSEYFQEQAYLRERMLADLTLRNGQPVETKSRFVRMHYSNQLAIKSLAQEAFGA